MDTEINVANKRCLPVIRMTFDLILFPATKVIR